MFQSRIAEWSYYLGGVSAAAAIGYSLAISDRLASTRFSSQSGERRARARIEDCAVVRVHSHSRVLTQVLLAIQPKCEGMRHARVNQHSVWGS